MATRKPDKPRGILNFKTNLEKFQLCRYLPSQALSFFIEHYWVVKWNLQDEPPHIQENLPHPSIHVVVEKGRSQIVGVVERKFTRVIEGKGFVFGIKFRPGGFFPFAKFPISGITNKTISLPAVFGRDGAVYENDIFSAGNDEAMVEIAESFINKRLPEYDNNVLLINKIIDAAAKDRNIKMVEDIVNQFGINKRKLQRIFGQYVGVSPKWIIKRYRLHEAIEQLDNGGRVDWTKLALELGYFDQPHFIRDFKAMIGKSPEEYTKKNKL